MKTGVSRATVRRWRQRGRPRTRLTTAVSAHNVAEALDDRSYSYVLGMYLGDGCITFLHRTTSLVIALDPKYSGVISECRSSMETICPNPVHRYARRNGVVVLVANWTGWPILFPQHGPGRKHERRIELEDWQREITYQYPERFIRGLIHSDGSRCMNRFAVGLPSGVRRYAYPRYFFTNYSVDIRDLFCEHCELLGIRWSQSNDRNISVSHRHSVSILDSFVGPKR